jgi:membrane protein implicated in regulation of membrane protease activity
MPTWIKYLLFQLPSWFALALFLWFLVDRSAVPRWAGAGFFVFWVVKDFAMYPLVRHAYEKAKDGTEQLIGTKGVARETLAPDGYIKIRGELWKAYAKGEPIARDNDVRVTGAEGMTLIVEAEKAPK